MSRNVLDPKQSGELIAKLSENVFIRKEGIAALSNLIYNQLDTMTTSTNFFHESEVHPNPTDSWAADWIFLVDTLNFCFWSGQSDPSDQKSGWTILYKEKSYWGYFALCAAINKAKELGKWGDITNPTVYSTLEEKDLAEIFKGPEDTAPLGLLKERVQNLKEVAAVLLQKYNGTFVNMIKASSGSAVALCRLIVEEFPCYRDEAVYKGHKVSIYKRAQILVADIWNCFEGRGLGAFADIDAITMFADYRVPQSLIHFGALEYTSELMEKLKQGEWLDNGCEAEVEIRGCSIHAVELLCAEVRKLLSKSGKDPHIINSIVLDNFLWGFRRKEAEMILEKGIPFHKTECIFY